MAYKKEDEVLDELLDLSSDEEMEDEEEEELKQEKEESDEGVEPNVMGILSLELKPYSTIKL